MTADNAVWPEYLMIRDTGLHDDSGGLGQRIYTTAGAGYAKVKYVRADIDERDAAEIVRLRGEVDAAELRAVRAITTAATFKEIAHKERARAGSIAPAEAKGECDMGPLCIGCTPRNADGSCPDAPQPAGGEAVAWISAEHLRQQRECAERAGYGMPLVAATAANSGDSIPLYTTPPAAQVQQEAVAEVVDALGTGVIIPSWIGDGPAPALPIGTKLYTHPAAGDKVREVCTWRKQDEYGDHVSTGCGHEFVLNDASDYEDGNPAFPFCCYCAKPTVFRQWQDEPDCTCDNSDGPECWSCSDRRARSALAQPQSGGDA